MAGQTIEVADTGVESLLSGCAEGQRGAIDLFYRRFHQELSAYARRQGAGDPEGVANLAIFEVIRRIELLTNRSESSIRAYLFKTVKNRIIDEHRSKKVVEVPLLHETAGGDDNRRQEDFTSQFDANANFQELMSLLTEAQREVIAHRFVAGYSSAETARRVGRSPAAVRRLQHDALARLRFVLVAVAVIVLGVFALVAAMGSTEELEMEPAESTVEVGRPLGPDTDHTDGQISAADSAPEVMGGDQPLSDAGDQPAAPSRGSAGGGTPGGTAGSDQSTNGTTTTTAHHQPSTTTTVDGSSGTGSTSHGSGGSGGSGGSDGSGTGPGPGSPTTTTTTVGGAQSVPAPSDGLSTDGSTTTVTAAAPSTTLAPPATVFGTPEYCALIKDLHVVCLVWDPMVGWVVYPG